MKARRFFLFAAFLVALALPLGIPTQSARADSVFLVNAFDDSNDGVCDSVCNFYEAFAAAQASPGGGTVKFDPKVIGAGMTYWATLPVHSSVTIDGAVTGGRVAFTSLYSGVFTVDPGATLNLQNIKVQEVYVTDAPFVGGAIYNNGGTVNVTNSEFFYNMARKGGAIFNDHGWLTVTNSTFPMNEGYDDAGGAIYNNGGTVTINSSWFLNDDSYRGSAIYNNAGTLTLANSIVARNYAAADGAIYNTGTASLINDTIAFNAGFGANFGPGGGLYNASGATLTLQNTIVAKNTAYNCSGSGIVDGGYNLDDGSTCGFSPANHSQTGVDPLFVRSYVDPTDPNGLTPLQPGSPAIDAADDSVCSAEPVNNLDQLGAPRPKGPHCDIGALEAQRATLIVINHVINDNGGTSSAADFTMSVAGRYPSLTSFAGAEAPGTVVGLAPGEFGVTQSGPDGYTSTASNCSGTIADNQTVTCTFTNDDQGPTVFTFSGFFAPVDNLPTLNVAKAGVSIPIKFSLGGDQGLNVLAAGYPASTEITCEGAESAGTFEGTVSAGDSGLSYDATTDTYTYVWKTDKAWAGTCRQLIVRLSDGTDHLANFKFRP